MSDQEPSEREREDGEYPPMAPHLAIGPDDPRSQSISQSRLIVLLLFGFVPLIVVFVIVLNSLASGPPAERAQVSTKLDEVTRYCTYSAKDQSDYKFCLGHTNVAFVDRDRSRAGQYAREELTRCLPDSGPLCTLR